MRTLVHTVEIDGDTLSSTIHQSGTINSTASPITHTHTHTHTSHRPFEGATLLRKQANHSYPSYIDFHAYTGPYCRKDQHSFETIQSTLTDIH